MSRTSVAHSVSAVPTATISTGRRLETNSTTTPASTRKTIVLSATRASVGDRSLRAAGGPACYAIGPMPTASAFSASPVARPRPPAWRSRGRRRRRTGDGARRVGVPVAAGGDVPAELGLDRARLGGGRVRRAPSARRSSCPPPTGRRVVAVGVGDAGALDAAGVRNAAAAFARAAAHARRRWRSRSPAPARSAPTPPRRPSSRACSSPATATTRCGASRRRHGASPS